MLKVRKQNDPMQYPITPSSEIASWARVTCHIAEDFASDRRDEDVEEALRPVAMRSLNPEARRLLIHEIAHSDSADVREALANLALSMAAAGDPFALEVGGALSEDAIESVRDEAAAAVRVAERCLA